MLIFRTFSCSFQGKCVQSKRGRIFPCCCTNDPPTATRFSIFYFLFITHARLIRIYRITLTRPRACHYLGRVGILYCTGIQKSVFFVTNRPSVRKTPLDYMVIRRMFSSGRIISWFERNKNHACYTIYYYYYYHRKRRVYVMTEFQKSYINWTP